MKKFLTTTNDTSEIALVIISVILMTISTLFVH